MIFGSRHERFVPIDINPSQLSLDIQAEQTVACNTIKIINMLSDFLPQGGLLTCSKNYL
jgi:hypothetical protein